jgi:predicted nucleic acid-binding protein
MEPHRSTTQWALDTNFLLHLADGKENVSLAWEVAIEKGISLFATGVVLDELLDLTRNSDNPRARSLATKALSGFRTRWKIQPVSLTDVEQTIAGLFAIACLDQGLVPDAERNDALVLAEASVKNIPFVISSDGHLLNIDRGSLTLLCHSRHVTVVSVLHPSDARKSLES